LSIIFVERIKKERKLQGQRREKKEKKTGLQGAAF
jgi:hypothetical protein